MLLLVVVFVCFLFSSGQTDPVVDSWYVAAVYEHKVILNPEPRVPLSRSAALQHMQRNLVVYEEQAARAALQDVQILVFPEDGLHGFNFSRSSISGYLETIPDPQQESWNPCTEPGKYNNTEVLQRLSCMARRYSLYLVANMAELQPCPLKTAPSSCPSDGRWQFNTNVVFRSDGLLVARYRKQNLYFEESFDTPPQPEMITFDTPFAGKFGLLICFDILFHNPTITLIEEDVRQLIFPTAWMNQLPLLDSIQFQRALSSGANVTLLAANIRNDQLIMTGSGIYTPSSATYHHAQKGDPEEGRLLVARVPVLHPLLMGKSVVTEEGEFVYQRLLPGGSKEFYALGAFAGMHAVNGRYALQVCALVRCAGLDVSSCGQHVEEAESKMDFLLEGRFGTRYVYPSILVNKYVLEQPEHLETAADGRVTMKHSNMTDGLVTACLYGRMYHLDNE